MSSQRHIKRFGVFTFTLILASMLCLAACGDSTETQVLEITDEWETRWLNNIPCAAPCWEGITPGKTTGRQHVVDILNQNPLMKDAKFAGSGTTYGRFEWKWKNGTTGGSGFLLWKDEIVYQISPYFNTKYKLSDIISKFGQPTHVSVTAGYGIDTPAGLSLVTLIYANRGFALRHLVLTNKNPKRIPINTDLTLDFEGFFEVTTAGYSKVDSTAPVLSWQGFKDFDFYCRPAPRTARGQKDCKDIEFS